MLTYERIAMYHLARAMKSFLYLRRRTLVLMVLVAASTLLIGALLSQLLSRYYGIDLPSIGNIRTIGVKAYADQQLKNELQNIAWGSINPGTVINMTCYIRSISNEAINLTMTTENWQYTNSSGVVQNDNDYIELSWDSEGKTLQPGQNVRVLLTLRASLSYDFINFLIDNQVQSFSFDILVKPQR